MLSWSLITYKHVLHVPGPKLISVAARCTSQAAASRELRTRHLLYGLVDNGNSFFRRDTLNERHLLELGRAANPETTILSRLASNLSDRRTHSVSFFITSSASSFFTSFFKTDGTPSTASLASLSPMPVRARTSLMTFIFALASNPVSLMSKNSLG